MKELQERIKKDGIAVNEDILKVDSFINHQVDPVLMLSLIHISEPTRRTPISYAVFCLKKKKKKTRKKKKKQYVR